MSCVGVALVVRTLARGGGALALGIVLGMLFVAAGAGAARACERRAEERRAAERRARSARRALFGLVYTMSVSSVYFALGVVAQRALGLTPLVFLVAGVFFALASMTYVEGASLHRSAAARPSSPATPSTSSSSFVAGWAILLDYVILLAVTAFTATNYLAAFWDAARARRAGDRRRARRSSRTSRWSTCAA